MTNAIENTCTEQYNQSELDEIEAQTQVEEVMAGLAPTELEQALDQLRPTLLAIPADEIRRLRTNPTYAVAVCLRVAEAFEQDRGMFAQWFRPEIFDVTRYDDLTQRGLALWQADIMYHRVESGGDVGAVDLDRAKDLRSKLLEAAEYLYSEHPELGPVVARIRKGFSRLGIADDLASLVNLFREQWEDAEPNCRITEADLEAATELCQQVIRNADATATRSEELEELLDLRQRAAEYLRRGVDDVRAAANYAFRDDAESLASYPSLFAGRRRKNGNSSADETEQEAIPAAPQALPVEPQASAEPVDLPPLEF